MNGRLTCAWCAVVTLYMLGDLCSTCFQTRARLGHVRDLMARGLVSEWGLGTAYDPNLAPKGEAFTQLALELYPFYRHIVVERRDAWTYIRPRRGDEEEEAA